MDDSGRRLLGRLWACTGAHYRLYQSSLSPVLVTIDGEPRESDVAWGPVLECAPCKDSIIPTVQVLARGRVVMSRKA
jgi:hypothetical protein